MENEYIFCLGKELWVEIFPRTIQVTHTLLYEYPIRYKLKKISENFAASLVSITICDKLTAKLTLTLYSMFYFLLLQKILDILRVV